jgi:predicted ATP-dependent endonuclease of OLD family
MAKSKSKLPINLQQIIIENYAGIKRMRLNFENYNSPQWIFLTGENGFGKTTILQALILGLADKSYMSVDTNNMETSISILLNINNTKNELTYPKDRPNNKLLKANLGINLINFVCYGASRLSISSEFSREDQMKSLNPIENLFSSKTTLLSIENSLVNWKLAGDKRFDFVKKTLKSLIPNLSEINIENYKVKYIEKEPETNERYESVDYLKLASGYKSIIAMVGDLIIRLSQNQPDVTDPKDLSGIVIIDEFDLHWHPKLQIQMPQLLNKAFPKIQFIVSTHSAIPLLGAPKDSVIAKVKRTVEEGITADILDIDLTTLTPNIILTSPIFDMDTITSVQKKSYDNIRTEETYKEMKHVENIDKYLKDKMMEGRTYSDELFK